MFISYWNNLFICWLNTTEMRIVNLLCLARSGAVGRGTKLHAGRSRVRFLMGVINPSGRTMARRSTQPLREMSTRSISWGVWLPVLRAGNLSTSMCRSSRNSENLNLLGTQSLCRPVKGLSYVACNFIVRSILVASECNICCLYFIRSLMASSSYRGADKSLARPTSRCILFEGENISFDASLVIYINSTNIPPIMIINRIYETQNLLSL